MKLLKINGGVPLKGSINLGGSKHSALAILGTILLMKGTIELENFPFINDTSHMLKILESLGVNVSIKKEEDIVTLKVDDTLFFTTEELWRVSKLRSSVLFLGSILVRFGQVSIPKPGGDKLGPRPMDEFFYILNQFKIKPTFSENITIQAELKKPLYGTHTIKMISKEFLEMGNNRTVLALIMAWANRGRVTINNAIILPEIKEVCYFLEEISGGYVTIDGIGTEILIVNSPGIKEIHTLNVDAQHLVSPDKCEYAFWIAAASLTRGQITIKAPYATKDFRDQMRWLRAKLLRPIGIPMTIFGFYEYQIDCQPARTMAFDLESTAHEPYGIAFDATPLFSTMLLTAEGAGSFYCFKFKEERIKWIKGIEQLGVDYEITPKGVLKIRGVEKLVAPQEIYLEGGDIRGASSVLLAALGSHGYPIVFQGLEHIERGMVNPLSKLLSLGANIEIIEGE